MAMLQLIPRKQPFFDLFNRSAANAADTARALRQLLDEFTRVEERVAGIAALEQRGDSITHEILERLNRSFVTPLEREDIHALASALDDVVDGIEEAAYQVVLYRVERPTRHARELARILLEMTERVRHAVADLRQPKKYANVRSLVIGINALEEEADTVTRTAMAELVEQRENLWELIRWRDIYNQLEGATDACEDVGDVLESIVLKHI
jgi:predicted phosphate transport protein (TIGR00153 family)